MTAMVAPASLQWELVQFNGGACADQLALERAGHTATAYGKYIYLLGGRKG
jgi:hypothetical protein